MSKIDWSKASKDEVEDEFYRMLETMNHKDMIDVVIGLIDFETKADFVLQWHEEDEDEVV